MVVSVPAIRKKGLYDECSCKKETDNTLKAFLKQSEKTYEPLNIISIHGSMVLNHLLDSNAPEYTELLFINQDLKKFKSNPHFDLVFFSLPENGYERSIVCESLCYCRMLLRPGGTLLFLTRHERHVNPMQFFMWKKSLEAGLLIRAGYDNLSRLMVKKQRTFLCGRRPVNNY